MYTSIPCLRVTACVTVLTVHFVLVCMRMLLCCAFVLSVLGAAFRRTCTSSADLKYIVHSLYASGSHTKVTFDIVFVVLMLLFSLVISSLPCVLSLLMVLIFLCLYEVLIVCYVTIWALVGELAFWLVSLFFFGFLLFS